MASDATYDVFLSHAGPDKPAVEELARRLRRRKIKPFLDKWHLVPGEPWQEALEEALDCSQTFAVFLGPGGIGPWQNEEMREALATRVQDKSRRVIPVLLPGASKPSDKALPSFLRRLTWVELGSDPDVFHRLVSGIKGLPPGEARRAAPASQPTMIGVPHRNPYFTGREDLLSRLHQQLQAKGITALAQAAIHGLGGIGKTQTAIEYAYRFGGHYRFVLWVGAGEETAIQSAYLSIARELKLVELQADLEAAVQAVRAWLSREDGWLLVFDNADDPGLVRPYLPPTRVGGKVLLTSRAKSFAKVGIREPFRVETLEPEDAVKFLMERTGNADAQAAAELATELGYLPLALEQAASYIETVVGGFAEYLARYRRQGVTLLAKGEPSTDYPKTVATTWTLSFSAVRKASPASAELLTAAAFLVPDSIPIEIFTLGGSALGDLLGEKLNGADEDPLVFWELLEPLERFSLVERLPDDAFKMHRLTQEVVKDSLDEEGRLAWAEWVARALNAAYSRFRHIDLSKSIRHAALTLLDLGNPDGAKELLKQALEFHLRVPYIWCLPRVLVDQD
jgi:catechol 2,3-dioxygenase-like lactoylglutathione lyase family enzyme